MVNFHIQIILIIQYLQWNYTKENQKINYVIPK